MDINNVEQQTRGRLLALLQNMDTNQLMNAIQSFGATTPPAAMPGQIARVTDIEEALTRAAANGGIPGFANERRLTEEELAFRRQMHGLGFTMETVDELFRHNVSSNESFRNKSLKYSHIIKYITGLASATTNRLCPDPSKVFLTPALADELEIIFHWVQFQAVTGGSYTSIEWGIPSRNHYERTKDRVQRLKMKLIKSDEDLMKPPKLEDMSRFVFFEDALVSYLKYKRTAVGVPFAYLIREESSVTDRERFGTVGPNGVYPDWDAYAIRCTLHSGPHYEADNATFFHILLPLIRDGPAYDYIKEAHEAGVQDGRDAYLTLKGQAYNAASVQSIINKGRLFYTTSKYYGATKNTTFEKFCRQWYRNNLTLEKYKARPTEANIVSDFCTALRDPLLDSAIVTIQTNPTYSNSFDKTVELCKKVLGIKYAHTKQQQAMLSSVNTSMSRDKSSNSSGNANTGNNRNNNHSNKKKRSRQAESHFDGTIRDVRYTKSVYNQFTPEQKTEHRRIREEAHKARMAASKKSKTNDSRSVSATTSSPSPDNTPNQTNKQFGPNAHKKTDPG